MFTSKSGEAHAQKLLPMVRSAIHQVDRQREKWAKGGYLDIAKKGWNGFVPPPKDCNVKPWVPTGPKQLFPPDVDVGALLDNLGKAKGRMCDYVTEMGLCMGRELTDARHKKGARGQLRANIQGH